MSRTHGARLAVPLLTIVLCATGLQVAGAVPAGAADTCWMSRGGIVCYYSGVRTTSTASTRTSAAPAAPRSATIRAPLPPLRYLAVSGGRCWYWSRYPPGYDSQDSAHDHAIIRTRMRLPQCRSQAPVQQPQRAIVVDVTARAWSVFRTFPLAGPSFRLTPGVGITNLPSRLHLEPPPGFGHSERLPDGRTLEVRARVESYVIVWGDGATERHPPGAAVGDPGAIRHTYLLKTCPAWYRANHLDGPKCHPTLDRYPVEVRAAWVGEYRAGGGWSRLGVAERGTGLGYDVDEILGVLGP